MTTIYIDTSILMNESFLRSASAQAVLKACSLLKISVVVPEVVVDEALGNYPKKLTEKAKAFQKAQKELARLVDMDVQSILVADAVDQYETWLMEFIDEYEVIVHPYPDVDAKELVEKAYEAKKPFKESGEGHKDYLVWHSIKSHIEAGDTAGPNILLTNNANDFCEQNDDGVSILHSDLSGQLADSAHIPKVYTSIKSFFDQELSPNLEGIDIESLPDLGIQDIEKMTEEFLLEDLPQRTAYGFEGVPFSNDVSIDTVGEHKIEDVSLKKVDDEVVILVTGTVDVEVDGFMEKHAYYHDAEDGLDVVVIDGNWNDHVMAVSTSIETAFELGIFYSTESNEVIGYELSLPQELEDEWPYK